MVAEYVFKRGFELNRFWATFTKSTDFGKSDSVYVNGQFLHCIANDVEVARMMIDEHYKSIGISCQEIELIEPVTTTNEDLKRLSHPTRVLGFEDAITIKTDRAQKVLQLMDSDEADAGRYMEFVKQISSETGCSIEQIEAELEPFV